MGGTYEDGEGKENERRVDFLLASAAAKVRVRAPTHEKSEHVLSHLLVFSAFAKGSHRNTSLPHPNEGNKPKYRSRG